MILPGVSNLGFSNMQKCGELLRQLGAPNRTKRVYIDFIVFKAGEMAEVVDV